MGDFDLEKEYGKLLDLIEANVSALAKTSEIKHYGVKGMKWGVRKDRKSSANPPLKSLGPDSVQRKTASGETITLSKVSPTKLDEFFGRRSKRFREQYSQQATLNILDGSGKKVGDAIVQKRSKDELYLEWLGINKSARGKGYATAVMQAGRDFGKQEGFKRMVLEVPGNSPDARHIYEKLGFKYTGEVKGMEDDNIWGGLSSMSYEFDEVKHSDSLVHYGVKGMKWGVRRDRKAALNKPNENYNKNQRRYDRQNHGSAGVKRINRRLNEGQDLRTARNNEYKFRRKRNTVALATVTAAYYAPTVLRTVKNFADLASQHVAMRAETNRGRAAAAATMGLPRTASSGPTYAKKKRSGAYNITSM